jgi:hypothetical protein
VKRFVLVLAMIGASIGPALAAEAAPATTPASAPEIVFCQFGEASLRLTCWDSSRAVVHNAVPFNDVLSGGWRLMHAYAEGSAHFWILERRPETPKA